MKKRIIVITLLFALLITSVPIMGSAQSTQSTETFGADTSVQQDCIKIKGILTENIYTDLDRFKMIDTSEEEFVEIAITEAFDTTDPNFLPDNLGFYNTMRFLVGSTNAADYLGLSVIAYVKLIDDNYEIISIAADTEKNEILEIDPAQYNQINSQGEFEYYESADAINPTAVNIENADIVFNNDGGYWLDDIFGDKIADYGETTSGGKITLINNDLENGYDVIIVELAEAAVVDEAEDGYVAFKNLTYVSGLLDLIIDEYDESVVVSITKDGEEISAADLVEWDVLSIVSNYDCTYIKAEVVTTIIVGTIDGMLESHSSATGLAYTINDTKYDAAEGAYKVAYLSVGTEGTFYIDKYGRLVAFHENSTSVPSSSVKYAYITDTAIEFDSDTWSNIALLQAVTANGVETLTIKSPNSKLDGVAFDVDSYYAEDTLKALEGTVVEYITNNLNLVTSITTANTDYDFISTTTPASQIYDADNGKFTNFYLDADALVFFIDTDDITYSYLGSTTELKDGETYTICGLYANDKAVDYNILVVSGSFDTPDEPFEILNEITVDMTESTQNWYFDVSADGIAETANVYAAIYDGDDRMLYAALDAFATDDLTTISIPKNNSATYAKIFILKTDASPAAISKRIDF